MYVSAWAERSKQIAKIWRGLSAEKRAPYLQKARENRAASRMQKAQQVGGLALKSYPDKVLAVVCADINDGTVRVVVGFSIKALFRRYHLPILHSRLLKALTRHRILALTLNLKLTALTKTPAALTLNFLHHAIMFHRHKLYRISTTLNLLVPLRNSLSAVMRNNYLPTII